VLKTPLARAFSLTSGQAALSFLRSAGEQIVGIAGGELSAAANAARPRERELMSFMKAIASRSMRALAVIMLAALAATHVSAQQSDVGINCYAPVDYARNRAFADVMKTARPFTQIGDFETPAALDARGWPTSDAQTMIFADLPRSNGTYAFSCTGRTDLEADGGTVANLHYDVARNRTTASLRIGDPQVSHLILFFHNTRGGVRDIRLMRPSAQGATTSYPANRLWTDDFLALVKRFKTVRAMDLVATNHNAQTEWSERVLPTNVSFNRTLPGYGWQGRGMPWEYVVHLANTTRTDLWVNVPVSASDDYVRNLALLLRDGSTVGGVTYAGLRSALKLYVEYSNELWNSGGDFEQSYTNLEAAETEVASGRSPLDFDGESNRYYLAWRRVGLRAAQISTIFRDVFGDAQMMSRIRPVLAWQQDDGQATGSLALDFVDRYFGAARPDAPIPHPVNWFFYGGGGSAYYNPENGNPDLTLASIWGSETFDLERWRSRLWRDAYLTIAYGLKRVAYEGGPSMDGIESAEAKRAAWGDPRMTDLIRRHHDLWSEMNGDLINYHADADRSYEWAFVQDVLPPYQNSAKMAAIDALMEPSRVRAEATLGRQLPVDLRGGDFEMSSPSWLKSAFGGGEAIELRHAREGERTPDWLLYVVRASGRATVTTGTLELVHEGGTTDASLEVRWDGARIASIPVVGAGSIRLPITVGPGVHGIVIRALGGVSRLQRVQVLAATTIP
jgi:hypothetical protein